MSKELTINDRDEFLFEFAYKYPKTYQMLAEEAALSYNIMEIELLKGLCEYVGWTGSYIRFHRYNITEGYGFHLIFEHIEKNEHIKAKLLINEL